MITKNFMKGIWPEGFCGDQAKKIYRRMIAAGKEAIIIEITPEFKWLEAPLHKWSSNWQYHIVVVCEGRVFDPWWFGELPTYNDYIKATKLKNFTVYLYNPKDNWWNSYIECVGKDSINAKADRELLEKILKWKENKV